jgi:hypothetical protein
MRLTRHLLFGFAASRGLFTPFMNAHRDESAMNPR